MIYRPNWTPLSPITIISNKWPSCFIFDSKLNDKKIDIKQLLDEVEHDIMNYQNRGLCYLPKPKAEADNTDTRV